MIQRLYNIDNKELNFSFSQNEEDFIVEEIPIKFSNKGNFLILKIKKRNLSTWDLITILSRNLNLYENEIGYAGLKDKHATTIQYISIPKKYSKDIKKFKNKRVEILDTFLHNNKLNIGDLISNRFLINLKNVDFITLNKIEKNIKTILKIGMPNYFGFQRFGKDVDINLEKAKDLIENKIFIKDRKLEKMLLSAYQSNYFNAWLVERLKINKNRFELLNGDIFRNKIENKFFTVKKINKTIEEDFILNKIIPTGLLPGNKVFRSILKARQLEEKFDNNDIYEKGYRRDAIIFPKVLNIKYNKETKICNLDFILPKGSYATVFIENIANKNFNF
ncbi:pseudouridine synthase [Malaciobacter molluscorum LMG 25693]|uniref:tRNA pseudouridine synthase D n=1 Tax=Malaciobacter molluscorum LMG 25693 TaxID=870501 RepID=A0A2G1DF84_9BACT|nr:tRNA pseudouridine(13) synthase TruD [Malaciobacter molluscorum]AXX91258.1 tRNA pseudouridine 13 synthase [Malaciobacter molluscorum LMG 25693]PHO17151.1 pseudouridine synthase [Malaciobacter molluscorum LMG 25693]RXJ92370.1 pseudouridine synthase [Malaciobacter molluscorum]